jgi:hypothetical protein
LYDAAHSLEESLLLTVAIALHRDPRCRDRQLVLVGEQLGPGRAARVRRYDEELRELGGEFYLPLLDITFPALRRRPAAQLEFLLGLLKRLVEIDDRIDLQEYCFMRIVSSSLGLDGGARNRTENFRARSADARDAAVMLLDLAARQGSAAAPAARALATGLQTLGLPAGDPAPTADGSPTIEELDRGLEVLRQLRAGDRKRLVEALAATILADKRLRPSEASLLRAVCAALDCPLPPLEYRL